MTEAPDPRPIVELDKYCMYDIRTGKDLLRGGFAESDNCRQRADSAVENDSGNLSWRCPRHRGLVKGTVTGQVHYIWPVKSVDK